MSGTRITAIYKLPDSDKWLFVCYCGNTFKTRFSSVSSGHTKSCGCLKKKGNNTTHKKSKDRVYRIWIGMKSRCLRETHKHYYYYGGRGIKISEKWINSFDQFLKDMGEPPTHKHTLDRIDANGNYEKDNCRWVTRKEQANNTRNTKKYFMMGTHYTALELEELSGIPRRVIKHRIDSLCWSVNDAVTTKFPATGKWERTK